MADQRFSSFNGAIYLILCSVNELKKQRITLVVLVEQNAERNETMTSSVWPESLKSVITFGGVHANNV